MTVAAQNYAPVIAHLQKHLIVDAKPKDFICATEISTDPEHIPSLQRQLKHKAFEWVKEKTREIKSKNRGISEEDLHAKVLEAARPVIAYVNKDNTIELAMRRDELFVDVSEEKEVVRNHRLSDALKILEDVHAFSSDELAQLPARLRARFNNVENYLKVAGVSKQILFVTNAGIEMLRTYAFAIKNEGREDAGHFTWQQIVERNPHIPEAELDAGYKFMAWKLDIKIKKNAKALEKVSDYFYIPLAGESRAIFTEKGEKLLQLAIEILNKKPESIAKEDWVKTHSANCVISEEMLNKLTFSQKYLTREIRESAIR